AVLAVLRLVLAQRLELALDGVGDVDVDLRPEPDEGAAGGEDRVVHQGGIVATRGGDGGERRAAVRLVRVEGPARGDHVRLEFRDAFGERLAHARLRGGVPLAERSSRVRSTAPS